MEREAAYWERAGERVRCELCPRYCRLKDGQRGYCGVRVNRGGRLWVDNYGRAGALHLDPTEKKPLFHFHPGSSLLSIGLPGCNLGCAFCQNWDLAHGAPPTREVSPQALVAAARRARESAPDCVGIAYTYAEPLMAFEYVRDTAAQARGEGLANVMVSNGYVNPAPLAELLPLIDAWNIDVKGFSPDYYRKLCQGKRDPVLETVRTVQRFGAHLEATTLLVTGLNDSPQEVEQVARFLAELSPDLPLHLSRYFPQHKLTLPPTPRSTLEAAREVARRHLRYVYLGNVVGDEVTRCPACDTPLLSRSGYAVTNLACRGGRCAACGAPLPFRGTVHA
ncbi:MAG: AmmeMemoRadiSam system radical SAM enzyme [Thermaerobacter sp.]|nr:AmmeMemoRadiSam system radical SAM enzyme [Thermaerobacter sp.]